MRLFIFTLLIGLTFLNCKKSSTDIQKDFKPVKFNYKEEELSVFFNELIENHYKDFYTIENSDIHKIFEKNQIDFQNNSNLKTFYTFKILNQLFTSKRATNHSKGEILNIPYFWHWVNPNPRYDILFTKTKQHLNLINPPTGFEKYKSYADVDRTPYLFLSDLAESKAKYFLPSLGEFKTFGWCSEREMAFVCLLKTMGYNGKVITKGNHSWSEFIVPLKTRNSNVKFKVTTDNTFDEISWERISESDLQEWNKIKNDGLGDWYNEKANSKTEVEKVKLIKISSLACDYIEEKTVLYLKGKFD